MHARLEREGQESTLVKLTIQSQSDSFPVNALLLDNTGTK